MVRIESYSFGRLTIGGKTYDRDVIIFPDGTILSPWWRKEGHRLELFDMEPLIAVRPATIVVGTGASGLMRLATRLQESLAAGDITLIARPTGEAVTVFNDLGQKSGIAGCFHLTC